MNKLMNKKSIFENLKTLYNILTRSEKNKLLLLQLLVIFSASLELISISLVSPYIEYVTNKAENSFFSTLYYTLELEGDARVLFGVGLIFLLFIGSFSSAISLWYLVHFAADLGFGISSKIYKKIIESDYVDFRKYNKNEIVNIVTNETTRLTDQVIQPLMIINSKIFLIILITLIMFIMSPWLSFLALFMFSISYLFIYYVVRKKLDRNSSDITRLNKIRLLNIDDTVSVFKEMFIYNKLNTQYKDFYDKGKILAKTKGQSAAISQVPRFLIEYLALMIVLMAFVIESSGQGGLASAVAAISGFGVAAFKLLPAAQQTYASIAMVKANGSALDEMSRWFDSVDNSETIDLRYKPYNEISFTKDIMLKDVNYTIDNKDVLKSIDFNIIKGQKIGLIGASGAGKSSFISVLLGLVKPDENAKIVLDGIEINSDLKTLFGYVPQDFNLMNCSILDNITMKSRDFDEEKLEKAINISQIKSFVDDLPDGINTVVDNHGLNLSGGQKQRIIIARAIYNTESILIFDEATSALDGIVENQIITSIVNDNPSITIVMVAHRLKSLVDCDVIHVMDEGEIVESGTHEYLSQSSLLFKKLNGDIHE